MKEDGRALIGQLFCFYVPSLSEGDVLIGKLFFIVHTHEEDVTKMIKGVKTCCTIPRDGGSPGLAALVLLKF